MSSKTVLVSGASGGLGPAVVDEFLAAGATVAGVARSWKMAGDPGFMTIEADLTTPAGARAVVERAGPVDVLVHVMGGWAGGKSVAETADDTWKSMLDLNLNSAFYLCRAVLPGMLERGSGRIIAIGSRGGVVPASSMAAYAASKAALHMLIQCIAAEVKDTGVTANAVMPSVIDTPANRKYNPASDYSKWVTPESIAKTIAWLASDASADVNGALIPIYGRA